MTVSTINTTRVCWKILCSLLLNFCMFCESELTVQFLYLYALYDQGVYACSTQKGSQTGIGPGPTCCEVMVFFFQFTVMSYTLPSNQFSFFCSF